MRKAGDILAGHLGMTWAAGVTVGSNGPPLPSPTPLPSTPPFSMLSLPWLDTQAHSGGRGWAPHSCRLTSHSHQLLPGSCDEPSSSRVLGLSKFSAVACPSCSWAVGGDLAPRGSEGAHSPPLPTGPSGILGSLLRSGEGYPASRLPGSPAIMGVLGAGVYCCGVCDGGVRGGREGG